MIVPPLCCVQGVEPCMIVPGDHMIFPGDHMIIPGDHMIVPPLGCAPVLHCLLFRNQV